MGLLNFGRKKEDKGCGCKIEVEREIEGEIEGECTSLPTQEIKVKCSCESQCGISDIKKSRFIVLGACCKKSQETFENTKKAVAEMGFTDEVLNIGDAVEISKYGVMQTPALVIDSKVVCYGKLLKIEDVKKFLEKVEK